MAIQLTGNVTNLAETQHSASMHADETQIARWRPLEVNMVLNVHRNHKAY